MQPCNAAPRLCRFAGVVLGFVFLSATGFAATAASDFIHADGARLVDGHGAVFAVKGTNLGNWLVPEGYMFGFKNARSPREIAELIGALVGPDAAAQFWAAFRDAYVSKEDIDFLKRAGFNTVRVPLDWRLFVEPGDGRGDDRLAGPGWALLDRVVQWCREAGLYAMIDLHAAPGGQTGVNHDDGPGFPLTFYVPRDRELTIALWRALAARYHAETAVLGYDLLNEPISPYSDTDFLNPRLEPLYRDIVAAVRSVDPNHVVVLGGGQWDGNFGVFGRPFDGNAVYTYHKFWSDPSRDAVQDYVNFSKRWNVPVLVGETGEFNDAWNTRFRELNERFGFGWIFWPYKNLNSHLSVVSIEPPDGWDSIAKAGSGEPLPPREKAQAILATYLEAARFKNVRVNTGYLRSLGLAVP